MVHLRPLLFVSRSALSRSSPDILSYILLVSLSPFFSLSSNYTSLTIAVLSVPGISSFQRPVGVITSNINDRPHPINGFVFSTVLVEHSSQHGVSVEYASSPWMLLMK